MAKKRSKNKAQPKTTDAAPLRNAAFAGLAGLRDALPAAAEPEAGATPAPAQAAATATDDGLPLPAGKVVVQREKKGRAGKTVVRVRGLATTDDTATRWAKHLKRKLGCGATTEGTELILLGDMLERVATALEAAGVARVIRGN